jgi:hypothetical protein
MRGPLNLEQFMKSLRRVAIFFAYNVCQLDDFGRALTHYSAAAAFWFEDDVAIRVSSLSALFSSSMFF